MAESVAEVATVNRDSLRIRDSVLEYLSPDEQLLWSTPINRILLVAEYTTKAVLMEDDYFLVFVVSQEGKSLFWTASFYANGVEEALRGLEERNMKVELGLAHSTDWDSRVVWPEEMMGQEYLTFTEVIPTGLRKRLSRRLFGPKFEYRPSFAVQAFVQSKAGV